METIGHSFGDNLRREIKRKGLTFGAAAELFDISLSFLNQLMRGKNYPSLEMLFLITDKLGVDPNTLLLDENYQKPPSRGETLEKLYLALATLDEEELADVLDWVGHFAPEKASGKGAAG